MKCDKCGGEAYFDPKRQGLLCDYCGNFSEINEADGKIDYAKEGLGRYKCMNCGATLLTFDDTAVTFCSYCQSSIVVKSRLEKENAPDLIIPFKISKSECEKIYKKYLRKFIFAPNYLKEASTISKFRGIYMPYAVYKLEKHGNQRNTGRKYSHRKGNYDYYDIYAIDTGIEAVYDGIAFDISSRFEDRFSKAIGPFDFNEAKPFNIRYLSGFYADSPDVEETLYESEAVQMVKLDAKKLLSKSTKKYGCANPDICFDYCSNIKIAYYPVYFLAIENKKGEYLLCNN